MINKELLPKDGLPLYEVEELSLVDAMLLLKGAEESDANLAIACNDKLVRSANSQHSVEPFRPVAD